MGDIRFIRTGQDFEGYRVDYLMGEDGQLYIAYHPPEYQRLVERHQARLHQTQSGHPHTEATTGKEDSLRVKS